MNTIRHLIATRLLTPRGLFLFVTALLSEGTNLLAILRFSAKRFPQQAAVTDDDHSLTYAELYTRCRKLAVLLQQEAAIGPGKRVALLCRNHATAVAALFAVSRTGADVYLLNPEMSTEQLAQVLQERTFSLLVCDDDCPRLPVERQLPVSDIAHLLQQEIPVNRLPKTKAGKIAVLSGGTSGRYKTAERKPAAGNFLHPFLALLSRIGIGRFRSVYIAVPVCHGYGLAALIVSLLIGKHVFLAEKYVTRKAAVLVRENRIEVLVLVPLMLQRLLQTDPGSFAPVQRVLSGGAPLSETLVRETLERIGPKLYGLYGTSEAGFSVLATPSDLVRHPATIGKPIRGVRLRVTDENGKQAKAGTVGMLCMRSRWTMDNRDEKWVPTGDLGFADANGYLFLRGRADNMIVSGGENVFPEDVERVLLQHPEIDQAAVIAVDDLEFGKRLRGFVVLKNGCAMEERELSGWLAGKIARYQVPAALTIVEALPVMGNGKVSRGMLREQAFAAPHPTQISKFGN